MTSAKSKRISFASSFLIHILILVLLYFIKWNIEYPAPEYVEIGFGGGGGKGSQGAIGRELIETQKATETLTQEEIAKKENLQNIDLTKTVHEFDGPNVAKTEKKETPKNEETKRESIGNLTEGEGSFGYSIDWGGTSKRRIFSYTIPEYPSGVYKEIDIRLRFSILPDGTVGRILPVTKADTRLENAAINSLRQWKFEPLPKNAKPGEQIAIIVFPYRLQ
ncbi:MAG: hypothetical protein C0425_01345 [Chlorobiaceae bacterium]|nr:hypothetical protein [Chlorobiaceae bacterium]